MHCLEYTRKRKGSENGNLLDLVGVTNSTFKSLDQFTQIYPQALLPNAADIRVFFSAAFGLSS